METQKLWQYPVIAIGIAPMALMVNWIIIPHAFVGGGLTGICAIIYYLTGGCFPTAFAAYGGAVPVWLSALTINALLLLVACFTVGWQFCLRTLVGVAALSFWFRVIPMREIPLIEDPWLAAIIGGIIFGLSLGVVMANNGSSGGTDIVARIVHHYRPISLGQVMLLCDVLIILSAFFLPVPESLQDGSPLLDIRIRRVLCGAAMTVSYSASVDWVVSRLHSSRL